MVTPPVLFPPTMWRHYNESLIIHSVLGVHAILKINIVSSYTNTMHCMLSRNTNQDRTCHPCQAHLNVEVDMAFSNSVATARLTLQAPSHKHLSSNKIKARGSGAIILEKGKSEPD